MLSDMYLPWDGGRGENFQLLQLLPSVACADERLLRVSDTGGQGPRALVLWQQKRSRGPLRHLYKIKS